MGRALLFPGQASQFVGMGSHLYKSSDTCREMIMQANQILDFDLSRVMFEGPEELLQATNNTQPAVFLHSMLVLHEHASEETPVAVAGHSLGEITALVASGVLSFEDGLTLVKVRAEAMQEACETTPGTMAAILGMEDAIVEDICAGVPGIVVPANYNCPGQLVISGEIGAVREAIKQCQEKGARRALEISVGGAFHSPLMEPAKDQFKAFMEKINLSKGKLPVYQNIDARPHTDPGTITKNLIDQIVNPVRWTESIINMHNDGISEFVEVGGKGKILGGMIRKITREVEVKTWSEND